jgi:hypothetical protein
MCALYYSLHLDPATFLLHPIFTMFPVLSLPSIALCVLRASRVSGRRGG